MISGESNIFSRVAGATATIAAPPNSDERNPRRETIVSSNWLPVYDSNVNSRLQRPLSFQLNERAIKKWRRMTGSNSRPFETVRCSRPVADHSAPLSMVADAGIEPARRTNLVLRVYKAQPHACAVGNKNWFSTKDSNLDLTVIGRGSCR